MNKVIFILFFCCSMTCLAQDWSSVGKKIIFSDTLNKAKKFTAIDRALENPTEVYYLDIYCDKSGVNIKKFSENILKFKNLRKLILNNQSGLFIGLTDSIWNLEKLEYLDIVNFSDLNTDGVKRLKKLKYLTLDGIGFTIFPKEILELRELECLNLSCNFLSTLPDKISMLENLKEIELTNNCFTNIPPQLSGIKMLAYITINNAETGSFLSNGKKMCENSITEFPYVYKEMKNLKKVSCFFKVKVDDSLKKRIKSTYPHIKFS